MKAPSDSLESHFREDSATPRTPATPVASVRLGSVTGDRRCVECGFNLRGQPVVREAHYHMVAVLCPECGTPTALTEYPIRSEWSRRLGQSIMMAVLLVMLVVFLGLGSTMAGLVHQAVRVAAEPLAEAIATEFAKSPQANQTYSGVYGVPFRQNTTSPDTAIDPSWWTAHSSSPWPTKVTPPFRAFGGRTGYVWLYGAAMLFPWAAILACVMPHRKRWSLMVIPLVTVAVSVVVLIWYHGGASSAGYYAMVYLSATDCAVSVLPEWLWVVEGAVFVIPLVLGAFAGRPLARRLIRWLVPPRQYVAFGFLWAADGLPMPKG